MKDKVGLRPKVARFWLQGRSLQSLGASTCRFGQWFSGNTERLIRSRLGGLLAIFVLLIGMMPIRRTQAANLSAASIQFYRMQTSVLASSTNKILVIFKPATAVTGPGYVKLTFAGTGTIGAASYGVNVTPANVTTSVTGLPSTYNIAGSAVAVTAAPLSAAVADSISGATATFKMSTTPGGDLAAGTVYGFFITGGITNPSSSGQMVNKIETLTSGSAIVDSQRVATRVLTSDQITVTAKVPATFNFTLSSTTVDLSDLDPSSVVSAASPPTVTITTNATRGWTAWLKDSNSPAALHSASASYDIATAGTIDATPTTLSIGSDGYVLDVDNSTSGGKTGTGTITVAAEYNGATTSAGGTLSNSYQEIAKSSGTAGGTGDVLTLTPRATISAITPAADDYTDTWTVIGAPTF